MRTIVGLEERRRRDAPVETAYDTGVSTNLVDGARRGDTACWSSLYRHSYPRLIRYAYHRLGNTDDAREAVAETMARAVAGINRFSAGDGAFTPWLFGICRNVVADCLHARYRHADQSLDEMPVELPSHDPAPDAALLADEEVWRVRQAFRRLDPDEQEVLELRVVAGLSSDEVAEALGKKPSTVRMAQMRALGRLRTFALEGHHA